MMYTCKREVHCLTGEIERFLKIFSVFDSSDSNMNHNCGKPLARRELQRRREDTAETTPSAHCGKDAAHKPRRELNRRQQAYVPAIIKSHKLVIFLMISSIATDRLRCTVGCARQCQTPNPLLRSINDDHHHRMRRRP